MTRRIAAGLDFETTGLDQEKGHRIIEVAAILHDLDTQERLGKFVQRINPERAVDPDAQAVHGISFEDVVGCPTWNEVGPKLSALLSRTQYVVAHNGIGFDMPFAFREFLRIGAPLPKVAVVDTMLQGRWATPDGAPPNLGALCFACDVPYDKNAAHAAEYDVEVMLECFFRQLPRGFFTLPTHHYELPAKEKK
jgi:DNA polymerase III subunit epsilon